MNISEKDRKLVFDWIKSNSSVKFKSDENLNGFINRMIEDEFTFEVALEHAKKNEPFNRVELLQCILTD